MYEMSMFLQINERRSTEGRSDTRHTGVSTDTMLRSTGIMALFGIGVIHFVQLVPTFEGMPLLGAAYLGLIAASIAAGALLVKGSSSRIRLWAPVAILGMSAIAGYAFTRVVSTPLDNADVGNWSCMLGMAALYVEGMLVLISGFAMVTRSASRAAAVGARDSSSGTPSARRLPTTGATTSTKPRSSTGANVPSVSQQLLNRAATDSRHERATPTEQPLGSKSYKS